MKKREFIAAICFICIFGMLVTVQVKRFVSSPSQRADVQEYTASKEYELKRTDQTGPVLKDGQRRLAYGRSRSRAGTGRL